MSALDRQVGGNHYKEQKYQVVEFLSDNMIPASLGYALKYVTRYPNKNQDDLDKALHCIELFEEWFEKNIEVEKDGNVFLFPDLDINLSSVLKFTQQFPSQKAILLQQIAQLADIQPYIKSCSFNIVEYRQAIAYVKESIIAYKEGTLE